MRRLQIEVLDDRVCPSGTVAIYDNNDGNASAIAGTQEFQNAASDFENSIGSHSWEDVIGQLQAYVDANGLIDCLYIFDHGDCGGPLGQQFGDVWLTPQQLALLEPLLANDAIVIFGGCGVGGNSDYCNAASEALGNVSVMASDTTVEYYNGDIGGQYNFYSDGNWQTFGANVDNISPADFGLYSPTANGPSLKKKKPAGSTLSQEYTLSLNLLGRLYEISLAQRSGGINTVNILVVS